MFYREADFKDTAMGKIPDDWEVARAERICKRVTDGTHDTPKPFGRGFFLITSKHIRNGEIDFSESYYIRKKDFDEVNKRSRVDTSDVLFSMIGTVGLTAKVKKEYPKFAIKNVGLFKTNNDTTLSNWLYCYFASEFAQKYIQRSLKGTTQKYIPLYALREFPIVLPSRTEQQKIAEVLSIVDLAIQKTDEVIDKTERLKQGLMQQLLTKGIGHKEFKETKIGTIPKEWNMYKLKYLIEKGIITYHLDGNHGEFYPRAEEFVSEGVPFLSANMISNGNIDFSKAKYVTCKRARQFRKGIARDGDILLAHNATVGPVAILKTELPCVILGTTLTSFRCNSSYLDNQYLKYYMEGPFFQQQLKRIMIQTTRNQVPITAQRRLQFIVPTLDEQQRIVEPLIAIDKKLELERKGHLKLERIKLSLMDLLLSGKVRVTVD